MGVIHDADQAISTYSLLSIQSNQSLDGSDRRPQTQVFKNWFLANNVVLGTTANPKGAIIAKMLTFEGK